MTIEYKVIVDNDGTTRWYNQAGELHRENGPALEFENGSKSWWKHGKRHREDGPAVEWADGDKEWWLNGGQVTEEEVMGKSKPIENRIQSLLKRSVK